MILCVLFCNSPMASLICDIPLVLIGEDTVVWIRVIASILGLIMLWKWWLKNPGLCTLSEIALSKFVMCRIYSNLGEMYRCYRQ